MINEVEVKEKINKASLNVRMEAELLESFRNLVSIHKQSTPPEVIREWIQKYVSSGGRDDHLEYAILSSRISNLEYQIRILSGEFERSEKADLNREPYKTAIENMKKTDND
jgi:hypothetical protein